MGRPRAAAPLLTQERITAQTTALVDELGLTGFTIRGLATALRVQPSSLYNHFVNRDEVLTATFDQLLERWFSPAPASLNWQEQLYHFAEQLAALAERHPHFLPYLTRERLTFSPQELLIMNRVAAALEIGGVPAAQNLTLTFHFVTSLAGFFHYVTEQIAHSPAAEALRSFSPQQASMFPAIAGAVPQHDPLIQDYTLLVQLFIAGIQQIGAEKQPEHERGAEASE